VNAVLGLDLGTSSAKAVVIDTEGCVLAQASAGYPVTSATAGYAESEPGDWWRAIPRAVGYWMGQHSIARIPGPWYYYFPQTLMYETGTLAAALLLLRRREVRHGFGLFGDILFGRLAIERFVHGVQSVLRGFGGGVGRLHAGGGIGRRLLRRRQLGIQIVYL